MRANSHKPGCMPCRLPPNPAPCAAPHAPAGRKLSWDRPMDNRKDLMASGAGFEAPEGLPRWGGMPCQTEGRTRAARGLRLIGPCVLSALQRCGSVVGAHASLKTGVVLLQIQRARL